VNANRQRTIASAAERLFQEVRGAYLDRLRRMDGLVPEPEVNVESVRLRTLALARELGVRPSVITKAIRVAHPKGI